MNRESLGKYFVMVALVSEQELQDGAMKQSLRDVSKISPDPRTFQTYEAPALEGTGNDSYSMLTSFGINYEYMRPAFAADLADTSGGNSGNLFRYDLCQFFQINKKLEVGLAFSSHQGTLDYGNSNSLSLKSYYLGPMIRYPAWKSEDSSGRVGLGVQQSLRTTMDSTTTASSNKRFVLDGQALQLGMDFSFPKSTGPLVWQLAYRKYWFNLSDKDTNTTYNSSTRTTSSFSLGVSYEFGWML